MKQVMLVAAATAALFFSSSSWAISAGDPADYPERVRNVAYEVDNAITGKKVVRFANGDVTINESTNEAVVRTARFGTFRYNLDDASLSAAGGDIEAASMIRNDIRQALIRPKGVSTIVSDANGNGVLDEALPLSPTCTYPDVLCTGYQPTVLGNSFQRFFTAKMPYDGSQPPRPDIYTCRLACETASTAEEEVATEMAEAGLACGLAESPPTFALCIVAIVRMVRNTHRRNQAIYTCRYECT